MQTIKYLETTVKLFNMTEAFESVTVLIAKHRSTSNQKGVTARLWPEYWPGKDRQSLLLCEKK